MGWDHYPKKSKMINGKLVYHPNFFRWRSMMNRCYIKTQPGFEDYGGRGIYVCQAWHDFWAFSRWCDETKVRGCSIDRIDFDGPYSPANCRWATPSEQQQNIRPNNKKKDAVRIAQQKRKDSGYADMKNRVRNEKGQYKGTLK